MYGDDSFFKDQNYRFHKGVVLQRAFPERIRGWISVFTGAIIIIYIAYPNLKEAKRVTGMLLKRRLIACANYFPVASVYRWKGKVEESKYDTRVSNSFFLHSGLNI